MDGAAAVYSLGVVLYELLAGSRPYRLKSGASITLLEQAIATAQVERPSTQLGQEAGTDRSTTQVKLTRRLKGDLDAIVLKALAKAPGDRYRSAEALADDVQRYLSGEPVEARPDRLSYRVAKFATRHRTALAMLAAAVTIIVAMGYALFQALPYPVPRPREATARLPPATSPALTEPPAMSVAITAFTAPADDVAAVRLAERLPRELTTVFSAAYHRFSASEQIVGASANVLRPQAAARYRVSGDVRSGK